MKTYIIPVLILLPKAASVLFRKSYRFEKLRKKTLKSQQSFWNPLVQSQKSLWKSLVFILNGS